MSSLGDLLLGKVTEPTQTTPPSSGVKIEKKEGNHDAQDTSPRTKNHNNNNTSASRFKSEQTTDEVNLVSRFNQQDQKVFPNRIEKNTVADDCQSDASSVDDYVAELLDPNDRPRNVWHVVEGPKESPTRDDKHRTDSVDIDSMTGTQIQGQKSDDDDDDDRYGPPSPREGEREPRRAKDLDKIERRQDNDDQSNPPTTPMKCTSEEDQHKNRYPNIRNEEPVHQDIPDGLQPASRDRHAEPDKASPRRRDSRERSSSSRRHKHRDEYRDRERDRSRDRHSREHPRRRSSDRHSKSSRRRREYSDDDEDDHHRKRHRSHRSGRHDRRSRSRSRSASRSRRRERSRSNSLSGARRNSRTVLIMQLSARVVERDLEEFFSEIGRVREVRLIMDSKTRRHKGIAYIEFDDVASANKALAMNGQKFQGAPMQIQSTSMEKGRSGDYHASSSSSHHHHSSSHTSSSHTSSRPLLPPNSYRVYVGGLHVGITEEMLRTIVEPFGMVHKIEVIRDRGTGFSRGYAFVTFASIEDGQEAVRNLDGFELAGKNLRVSKSTEKSGHA